MEHIDLSKHDAGLENFQKKGKVFRFVYVVSDVFELFLCNVDTKAKHHFKGYYLEALI